MDVDRKQFDHLYACMRKLEYILDSTNQRRKREDKKIREAWGMAFYMKGVMIEMLDYYQPTLLMMLDKYGRNKNNPTWTKRAKKIFHITQRAKGVESKK